MQGSGSYKRGMSEEIAPWIKGKSALLARWKTCGVTSSITRSRRLTGSARMPSLSSLQVRWGGCNRDSQQRQQWPVKKLAHVPALIVLGMVVVLIGLLSPVKAEEVSAAAEVPAAPSSAPGDCRCDSVLISCSSPQNIAALCQFDGAVACADKRTCKMHIDTISCALLGLRSGMRVAPGALPPDRCLLENRDGLPHIALLQACASVLHEAHHLRSPVCMEGGHTVFSAEWLAFAHEGGYFGFAAEQLCAAQQMEPEHAELCDQLCETHLTSLAYSFAMKCARNFMESPEFNVIPSMNRLQDHCLQQCESSYQFVAGNPTSFPPLFSMSCRQRLADAKDVWVQSCQEGLAAYLGNVVPSGGGAGVPVEELFLQEAPIAPQEP